MVTSENPRIRGHIGPFVRARAPLLVAAFLVGGSCGASLGSSPSAARDQSEAGLLELLGQSAQCSAERARWEQSGGWVKDWVFGRGILFECRAGMGPRDIYRAAVRLSPEGILLGAVRTKNLTRTSDADESSLTVAGPRAAYISSSKSFGVTLLERRTKPISLEGSLRSLTESGTLFGYQKTHFYFPEGLEAFRIAFEGTTARVEAESTAKAELNLKTLAFTQPSEALRVEREPVPRSPLAHLGADLLRSAIGAEPVAYLERQLFQAQDLAHRVFYHSTHSSSPPASPPRPRTSDPPPGEKRSSWPPADPDLDWQPIQHAFLPRPGGTALAERARVHPDEARPYVETELVEFDMRYLELGIRGGYMEPRPETGAPEGGHVPDDPDTFRRIVATLNGGFQSSHGKFGMKSDGRLLIQPSPGLATVRVDERGWVELGTWATSDRAEDFVSFRQNLEPLFVGSTFDPNARGHFGDHLLHGGVFTERSALCVNERKNLIFAWSKEIDPKGLAESMQRAGCTYGIHLDMNPGHCSLTFHKVESFQPLRAESALLSQQMKVNANRFLRWSPKDFFYLATFDGMPKGSTLSWSKASSGPDTDAEVVYQARTPIGTETVTLFRTVPRGARYFAQPGSEEGGSVEDSRPALFRLGLGHRTHGSRPGLAVGKKWLVPAHRGFATIEIPEDGTLRVHEPGTPVLAREGATLVQLPFLVRDGVLSDRARSRGAMSTRAALCQGRDDSLIVAQGQSDSFSAIAAALVREGCRLVMEADRGSHFSASAEFGSLNVSPAAETLLLVSRREPSPIARHFTSP